MELGCIDIHLKLTLMPQYHMNMREGCLEAIYLIFHFLWKNPKKRQVMDPSTTMIYESVFHYNDYWVEFYGDVVEEDPPQMPDPRGEPVSTSTFVDSEHASNVITRRSHTGILLFICNGIIKALIKQQKTAESSTFGSEMVALRIYRYMIV